MTINLISEGWYLLSGISGKSVKTIINDDLKKADYLDISVAYVPLYKDIPETSDLLNPNSNLVTDISVNDLSFNETIGPVKPYPEIQPNYFGKITNLDTLFNQNIGFWVYLERIA